VSCCQPFILGKKEPREAAELLRARYSAFVKGEIPYIVQTHHPETAKDVDPKEVEDWSKNSKWLGLKIVETQRGGAEDTEGVVIFEAPHERDGKRQDHYEYSQFKRLSGAGSPWRFLDAQGLKPGPIRREGPKVGRNDPCPCGSGKKQKKCHGLTDIQK